MERNQKGRCIKKCQEGKIRNPLTGRCIKSTEPKQSKKSAKKSSKSKSSKKSAKKSSKKSAKKSAKKSSKKSAEPKPSKKSAKKSAEPKASKKSAKKSAEPKVSKKSAKPKASKKPSKKSDDPKPSKKSAEPKPKHKKGPVFAHWPIRPNEMTLEEYNMFQEYNAFKPDDTIDLNLETLKDVKKFYRKLQIILHPDRNKNVRLELFDKMQALYNKRYNNDRLNAQGYNTDWKKSGL
jgi:DNA mismatch repair ATPase MutL